MLLKYRSMYFNTIFFTLRFRWSEPLDQKNVALKAIGENMREQLKPNPIREKKQKIQKFSCS